MRRVLAMTAVFGLAATMPAALASAAEPQLGGYTVRAQAAPVTAQLWEPVLPTPTEPQGELSFSYTRSTMDTGPSSRALASSLWPGETLGEGFGTVIGQEGAEYPIKIVASYPGGEGEAALEPAHGVGMSTRAADDRATSLAQFKAGTDAAGDLLATARAMSSTSEVRRTASTVTAVADAAASEVELLGGMITVEGVRLRSTATSDGAKGSTGGTVSVSGLRIADKQIRLGEHGLGTGDDQDTEIPEQPTPIAELLDTLGIRVDGVQVTRAIEGPTARQNATALMISIDTTPLRQALDAPFSALREALPDDVASELAALFEASPRIVYLIGNTATTAGGSPAIDFAPLPIGEAPVAPVDGTAVRSAGLDESTGTGELGAEEAPVAEGDLAPAEAPPPELAAAPLADTRPVASFGGVPGSMVAVGLLLAGAIGLGVRKVGAAMLAGAATCELGLSGGIPSLRKG